ncbi:hypothetical protein GGR53DRAFT_469533 [Hypoxylon sp. FL1150]|nr:hypothetical protein GGR53DRAFT_469533 [Hypoxylon sp. FL1150]
MSRRSPVLGCAFELSIVARPVLSSPACGHQPRRQCLVTVLFSLSHEHPTDNGSETDPVFSPSFQAPDNARCGLVLATARARQRSSWSRLLATTRAPPTMLATVFISRRSPSPTPHLDNAQPQSRLRAAPLSTRQCSLSTPDNAQPRSCLHAAPAEHFGNARMDLILAIHRASRQCLVVVLFAPQLECHQPPTPVNARPVLFRAGLRATDSVSAGSSRSLPRNRSRHCLPVYLREYTGRHKDYHALPDAPRGGPAGFTT